MATTLPNGIILIDLGDSNWREDVNNNIENLYSKNEIDSALSDKEDVINKTPTWQATPDNVHYPSEKLVKDSLDQKANINGDNTINFQAAQPSADEEVTTKVYYSNVDIDLEFINQNIGLVLKDRTNSTLYRVYINNNNIELEAI